MKKIFSYFLIPLLLLIWFSCSSDKGEQVQQGQQEQPRQANDKAEPIAFEEYEVEAYPDAIIEMYSPLGNDNFEVGKVPFEFNIKNYPHTEGLIGFQYRLTINGNSPVSYHLPIFQKDFNTGTYRAVAYLIDKEGLALKEFGNYVDRDFTVGESKPFPESNEPYMVLNLPGEGQVYSVGEEVVIDFVLIGGGLKEDQLKFVVELNGQQQQITNFAPLKVKGLPLGQHEIKVMLVRENGEEFDGIFNSVTRSITVE